MSKRSIPDPDDDFNHWSTKFYNWVNTNGTSHGLTGGQITAITTLWNTWNTEWSDFNTAKDAFHAATQAKDSARAALEEMARALIAIIQKDPNTTNEDREQAGLTIPSGTHAPVPVPLTWPQMQRIDVSSRCIQRLFYEDSSTPGRKAKPPGVAFAEIRFQVGGTMPTDPNAMTPLAMEGRAPYRADFDTEDIGKTVYYVLRWVNSRGEAGPWSPFYNAVVPG